MSIKYYFRKNCRLCDSTDLDLILKLKSTPLCDAYTFVKKEQDIFPLNLYLCKECGFVQINCVLEATDIYKNYLYKTTSSTGLSDHFYEYAESVINRLKLKTGSTIVDIGSNEGTLLKYFKSKEMKVFGVEPVAEIAKAANLEGIPTFSEYFNEVLVDKILKDHGHADVITINNTFANIDNLSGFTSIILKLLSSEGVIIIESSYLLDMIKNLVFDFIYHEHYSYLSIIPLMKFFSRYEMHLIDLQNVSTKGGSMRYFFAKNSSIRDINNDVEQLLEKEKQFKLNDNNTYKNFSATINNQKNKVINELERYKNNLCVGYGASASSTTLLYEFELNKYLKFLIDDNPAKIGTYSPGLNIPVKDSTYLYEANVDAVVVLAWRFADQIKRKHSKYKGRFVVPL